MSHPWDAPAPEAGPALRRNVAGLGRAELRALMLELGEPAWRADQLFVGLYRQGWTEWDQFTTLSRGLRERLAATVVLAWPAILQSQSSADASTKHVFGLMDGRQVEGVHMPYAVRGSGLRPTPPEPPRQAQHGSELGDQAVRGSGLRPTPPDSLDRITLCLSSQVGCAMGCTFCATGQMGIIRNLSAAEIVGQVMAMLLHHQVLRSCPVNLVFMGMGEPLHNLEQVMAACEVLADPDGLALPPRRMTLSTSGLVPGIERLGTFQKRPRLAVSLNGTTDAHRSSIMPVNRVWNLEALAATLSRFPLQSGERITLEYVLLKGITDSLDDGRRLVAFARQFPAKVNLIPFNPHEGAAQDGPRKGAAGGGAPPARSDGLKGAAQDGPREGVRFEPPDEARISALCRLLSEAGLPVSVRRSRGQDVAGACGQLVRAGQSAGRPLH